MVVFHQHHENVLQPVVIHMVSMKAQSLSEKYTRCLESHCVINHTLAHDLPVLPVVCHHTASVFKSYITIQLKCEIQELTMTRNTK
jgi:hypothetical protein